MDEENPEEGKQKKKEEKISFGSICNLIQFKI
jgi:hypothetical protein